jgi:hypothetical protein
LTLERKKLALARTSIRGASSHSSLTRNFASSSMPWVTASPMFCWRST